MATKKTTTQGTGRAETVEEMTTPLPGYLSVREAAQVLGVSQRSVYGYIDSGRLPAMRFDYYFVLNEKDVYAFERRAPGRAREKTPLWHEPPAHNRQFATIITLRLRDEQEALFKQKLIAMRRTNAHCFPGTQARFILHNQNDPGEVIMLLIWREAAMPPAEEREAALSAFAADFADVLDWSTAERREGRVVLHA